MLRSNVRMGQILRLAVLFLSITALWSMVRPPAPQSAAAAGKPAAPNAPAALNVAPANDFCAGAQVIPATAGTNTVSLSTAVDITDATASNDPPVQTTLGAYRTSRSVWYTFTPLTSTTYLIDTSNFNTSTTVQDTVMWLYTSTGGCAGPFTTITANDEPLTTGVLFNQFVRHRARISAALTAGTTYHIVVWKFGLPAPSVGQSTLQVSASEGAATATPTNTGIAGGTPGTPDHNPDGAALCGRDLRLRQGGQCRPLVGGHDDASAVHVRGCPALQRLCRDLPERYGMR